MLILLVSGAENNPEKSNTQIIEKHQFADTRPAFVDIGKHEVTMFELKQGPDCIERLLQSLEMFVNETFSREKTDLSVHGKMQKKTLHNAGSVRSCLAKSWKKSSTIATKQIKFMNRKTANFKHGFAHKLSKYDLHCIVRSLRKSYPYNLFPVTPSIAEKFIS